MQYIEVTESLFMGSPPTPDEDWEAFRDLGIRTVVDTSGGIDAVLPSDTTDLLYVYFPFEDGPFIPDEDLLHEVAELVAGLCQLGVKVYVASPSGMNRSALVVALVLQLFELSPKESIDHIRSKRPTALHNASFEDFVLNA